MKKRTARSLVAVLVISYLIIISGGIVWWMTGKINSNDSQETLSEADASDNVGLWEKEEEQQTEEEQGVKNDSEPAEDNSIQEEANDGSDESVTETQEHTAQTEKPSEDASGNLKMLFTGDVYIGNYVSSVYDAGGIRSVLSEALCNEFQTADISMVNQEFPFSTRGEPMADKQYTFRVAPEKVSLFTDLGIDIVSLANNHALDYGEDALLDSMDTLTKAGITYVGVGRDLAEAKTTRYIECNQKTVAILSASRVIPVSEWAATYAKPGMFTTYEPTALLQEIKTAREKADFVVVYLHWGLEKKEYPESYQRTMGRQFIDAGADVVIGSHPHVLQGFEYYNGKLIAYSLGNFIFSQTIDRTAMLTIDLAEDNTVQVKVIPCKTVNGKTQELTDPGEISKVYDYLSGISENAGIDSEGCIIGKE